MRKCFELSEREYSKRAMIGCEERVPFPIMQFEVSCAPHSAVPSKKTQHNRDAVYSGCSWSGCEAQDSSSGKNTSRSPSDNSGSFFLFSHKIIARGLHRSIYSLHPLNKQTNKQTLTVELFNSLNVLSSLTIASVQPEPLLPCSLLPPLPTEATGRSIIL